MAYGRPTARNAFRKSGALCSREHPSVDHILLDCAALCPKLDANWNFSGGGSAFCIYPYRFSYYVFGKRCSRVKMEFIEVSVYNDGQCLFDITERRFREMFLPSIFHHA